MNPRLDIPQFFLSDAANAAGVDQNTLKTWINRKAVLLSFDDRPGEGAGSRRLLTLRTVYAIAIAAEFVRLGLSPARGFQAALGFTHSGRASPAPGELYPEGETLLVLYPQGDDEVAKSANEQTIFSAGATTRLVNVRAGASIPPSSYSSAAIVNCNEIYARVDSALSKHSASSGAAA